MVIHIIYCNLAPMGAIFGVYRWSRHSDHSYGSIPCGCASASLFLPPRQPAKCLRTVSPYGRILFPRMRTRGGAMCQSLPSCRGGRSLLKHSPSLSVTCRWWCISSIVVWHQWEQYWKFLPIAIDFYIILDYVGNLLLAINVNVIQRKIICFYRLQSISL